MWHQIKGVWLQRTRSKWELTQVGAELSGLSLTQTPFLLTHTCVHINNIKECIYKLKRNLGNAYIACSNPQNYLESPTQLSYPMDVTASMPDQYIVRSSSSSKVVVVVIVVAVIHCLCICINITNWYGEQQRQKESPITLQVLHVLIIVSKKGIWLTDFQQIVWTNYSHLIRSFVKSRDGHSRLKGGDDKY